MSRCNINIYNDDCLQAMRDMRDNEFDLAIVDPPYGMEKSSTNGSGKLKHRVLNRMNTDWDVAPKQKYFTELFRVSRNQIIWGGNYFGLPSTRCFLIWDKKQYMPTFSRCEYAWTSFYKPAKIFEYDNASKTKIHPTQKPVKLYKWLLTNYAKEGDKILDTHLGSGSIAIACWDLKFDLTGYEIDKEYYDNAIERIERHKRQLNLF